MGEPGPEVTGWVDGIPGGASEGQADPQDEQRNGQRIEGAKAVGRSRNGQCAKDQHEGADGLSDEVHRSFVPERFASMGDFIADCFGSLVGGIFYQKYFNRT